MYKSRASKTLAERAAWDFVRTERPNFTLSTINPPMVYGPVAHTTTLKSLNQSVLDIWQLMSGEAKMVPMLVSHCLSTFANVLKHTSDHSRVLTVADLFLFPDPFPSKISVVSRRPSAKSRASRRV